MNDPADQKASDEAIKRVTNLTPTGVRQALDATAIDFQRRTDAQNSAPTFSEPRQPPQISVSETKIDTGPVVLPFQGNDSDNAFPNNSLGFPPTGTFVHPYIMGTNRTTTDPDPADDYWLASDGPHPAGGGPYDGVSALLFRFLPNDSGPGFWVYSRTINFDSVGDIFSVTIETQTGVVPSP